MTTKEFIERSKTIHGNKYDYSKVEYVNCKSKVCIICPNHGEFWQNAESHYSGRGCSKCGRDLCADKTTKLTYDICYAKAKEYTSLKDFRLNNKSIYSVAHKNNWIKDYVWLTRKQKPNGYWNNYELCKEKASKCYNVSEFQKKYSNAHFWSKKNGWIPKFFPNRQVKRRWNERDSLEEAKKYNSITELQRGCSGAYNYLFKNRLFDKCVWFSHERKKRDNSSLVQSYIDKCVVKYNSFYDYSKIDIPDVSDVSHTKVPIICPDHGIFYQNLYNHLHGVIPCPSCRRGAKNKNENKDKIKTIIKDRIEHGVIYCYTNKMNGKKYIGQTISEKNRKKDHLRRTQRYKILFDKVLQKKGIQNFEYEILFEIDEKRSKIFNVLNDKEKFYIKLYNSQVPNGYNISEGGNTMNWMIGYKPSKETLKKLSDSHKGKTNPMKGKHYSEETRKSMSEKRHRTMQKKYDNGYIAQRKNIVMFIIGDDKQIDFVGVFPNAKEIERRFNINYNRIHYVLKRKTPLDNKYVFIHEKEYNNNKKLIDDILTKKSCYKANINVNKKVEQ